jgi:hypothetical protein
MQSPLREEMTGEETEDELQELPEQPSCRMKLVFRELDMHWRKYLEKHQ